MAKPLLGKRIVVTRAQEQSAEMATQLEQLGAIVIRCPLIAFDPLPTATAQLDAALQQSFDWLLFTSQNGVRFFFESFVENKAPPPNLPQ
ncbi:MAG: uroporphyrinogen-III synthase, partial [Candidatus Promineifilaceae bacterium]